MSLPSRTMTAALCLLTLFGIRPTSAQHMSMRFDIPFRFYVGDKILSAGTYVVVLDRNVGYVELHNRKDYAFLTLYAKPAMRDGNYTALDGRLRFYRYGTTLVLKQVWMSGELKGGLLQTSKAERALAKMAPALAVAEIAAR